MLEKIVKITGYVILGLAAIISVLFFLKDAKVLQNGLDALGDAPSEVKIAEIDKMATDWSAIIVTSSIVIFILAAATILLFSLYNFIRNTIDNPKSAIKPSIVLVLSAIVIIISYSLASDVMPDFLGAEKLSISGNTIKLVEASLYLVYILFGISIVALIYTEVSKIFR